jgi:hypothetical protein
MNVLGSFKVASKIQHVEPLDLHDFVGGLSGSRE